MKIMVAVKRVIDPYVKIHVRADNSGVETNNVKMSLNPFDEIALEEALRWREKNHPISEIIVVSIGNQAVQESLRTALALGADRAIHVLTEEVVEPLGIAKILKACAIREGVEMVLLGKQAIDFDSGHTGGMLAGLLAWPQATCASQTAFLDNNRMIDVTREVDGGLETVRLSIPCVITVDLRLNDPRYPTLPNIMKAKQKAIQQYRMADLDINYKNRLNIMNVRSPTPRKPGIKLSSVGQLAEIIAK
jgi:electron transfer flavoprotein beta subunit